jgi:hypothetical protein
VDYIWQTCGKDFTSRESRIVATGRESMERRAVLKSSKVVTVIVLIALLAVGCTRWTEQWIQDSAVKHIAKALDLDDNQKTRLEEVENQILQESRELCLSKDVIEDAVKKQIQSEAFNDEELKQVLTTEMTRSDSVMRNIVDRFSEFHATLNSEQRIKLSGLIYKWSKNGHRGRHSDWCKGVRG